MSCPALEKNNVLGKLASRMNAHLPACLPVFVLPQACWSWKLGHSSSHACKGKRECLFLLPMSHAAYMAYTVAGMHKVS